MLEGVRMRNLVLNAVLAAREAMRQVSYPPEARVSWGHEALRMVVGEEDSDDIIIFTINLDCAMKALASFYPLDGNRGKLLINFSDSLDFDKKTFREFYCEFNVSELVVSPIH